MKILVTYPNSIAGTLILKGFAEGFRQNGCRVLAKDLRELKPEEVNAFEPDMILGYDYGFLFYDNPELNQVILNSSAKIVSYFADEPCGKFAVVEQSELFNKFLSIAKTGRIVSYIWDKDFVLNIPNTKYLPLAADIEKYSKYPQGNYKYEISFVGRPLTDVRQRNLAQIVKHFGDKLSIFSYEKHFLRSIEEIKPLLTPDELELYKAAYKGFLKTEEELAQVYSESKINLNITLQGSSNLNYRVFEVLASKAFLITDYMQDLEELFQIGTDLVTYKNTDELIKQVELYIGDAKLREQIARNGFERVKAEHTYCARAKIILDDVFMVY